MTLIEEFSQYVQRLLAATSPAQVGAVYKDMVGYDSHAENPAAALEDLRALALDYVREWCDAENVRVADVGLTRTDDTVVAEAVTAALGAACKIIQDHLGVSTGDFAGLFFSGDAADPIREVLSRYLKDQRADEQRTKDSGFVPL